LMMLFENVMTTPPVNMKIRREAIKNSDITLILILFII
jgi:hypothetical protein